MRRHLYFYTHVTEPFAAAAELLAADPSAWLPSPAAQNGAGWYVTLRAEGALPARVAERTAAVATATPRIDPQRLLRPIGWKAVSREQLFPVFTGDLALDELQGDGCQLSLVGTYRRPLSVVGGAGDALLGHRVAEAVVRRFVLDVADRIASPQPTP